MEKWITLLDKQFTIVYHINMRTIKEKILSEYAKTKVVRQSYWEIAKKVGCTKAYVFKIIKASNLNRVFPKTRLMDISKKGNRAVVPARTNSPLAQKNKNNNALS